MIENAPRKKDRSEEQPPLFPEEEKKPEPVTKIDWDAIKKAGDENQKDLEKERANKKKDPWTDH